MKLKLHNEIEARNSSVELLKVVAIFMIVLSHSTQTVGTTENLFGETIKYAVNYRTATRDVANFALIVFRHFGAIGNVLFMVSSSWFLLESSLVSAKKVFEWLFDVWGISVTILLLFVCGGMTFNKDVIIRCMFPTLFNNNWYITCYIIVYMAHGLLNTINMNINR